MIFISYYTKKTVYENVIKKYLLPSLKKWELPYIVAGIDNFGTWSANTGYKSKFILETLEKYKEDIIFLDADATIERYPHLFLNIPEKYDIAFHWLDWHKFWRKTEGRPERELLSGTLMCRYNEKVIALLKNWQKQVQDNIKKWEQKVLQKIIKTEKHGLKIYNLPIQYCSIIKGSSVPEWIKEPVIVHHQVSRKYRRGRIT